MGVEMVYSDSHVGMIREDGSSGAIENFQVVGHLDQASQGMRTAMSNQTTQVRESIAVKPRLRWTVTECVTVVEKSGSVYRSPARLMSRPPKRGTILSLPNGFNVRSSTPRARWLSGDDLGVV